MRHIVTHFRKRAFNVRKKIEEPNSLDASSDEDDVCREIKPVDENVFGAAADDNRRGKVNKRRPNSSFHHGASEKGLMEKLKEKPKGEAKKTESFKLQQAARQPPTVMPNIKPRPNLHAQHHNLDTLERLVFEDFNATPYTSKSTIVISGWDAILCDWKLIRRKFQFIDPRGYINISWLFVQVS